MATVFKRGGRGNRKGWYYISYHDHTGKRVTRSARTTDKAAAERLANRLETEAMEIREGLVDPTSQRIASESRRSLSDHLADFKTALIARGNTLQHCEETVAKVARLLELSGASYPSDLTSSGIAETIDHLRDDGLSLATCNHYLRAIKSFSRWMYRDKRVHDDVFVILQAYNAGIDRRHIRREATPEELIRLIHTTERRTRPEHNMSGPDRAMVYRLALGTGFRAKELRSLTPSSFDLDGDPPTITPRHAKNGRPLPQLIRRDLAEIIRPWLRNKSLHEEVFSKLPRSTARMLRADLRAARAEWVSESETDDERALREASDFLKYENSDGKVFDFHATRHTYISGIVAGGASVKVAQELARHSTPSLTIGLYSHTRLHDIQGALESLPSLSSKDHKDKGAPSEWISSVATGTYDKAPGILPNPPCPSFQSHSHADQISAQRNAQRAGRELVQNDADRYNPDMNNSTSSISRKSLAHHEKSEPMQLGALPREKYPLGESNPCFRTENPMS